MTVRPLCVPGGGGGFFLNCDRDGWTLDLPAYWRGPVGAIYAAGDGRSVSLTLSAIHAEPSGLRSNPVRVMDQDRIQVVDLIEGEAQLTFPLEPTGSWIVVESNARLIAADYFNNPNDPRTIGACLDVRLNPHPEP